MTNSPSPHLNLEAGVVLAGKYRVERVIGQGGMGVVLAARHIQLDQRVALKLMLPHATATADAVARFMREARAAARISSEHVARVFDVGALASGEPYIAMEYLEGSDIAGLLAAQGPVKPALALEYVLQACEALAEAHCAGIVHRDLKPGNLFVARRIDGRAVVKVLDFGISKMTGGAMQSSDPTTRASTLMGSPLYMSPEQMGSATSVDARSDIWALGVVLYEMLSGAPPFNGETLPQVIGTVMREEPAPLSQKASEVPPQLCEVVHRCMQKEPSARFQNMAEFAQSLWPLASTRGRQSIETILRVQGVALSVDPPSALAAVVDPATSASSSETYAPLSETQAPQPPRPFRRGPMVAAGLALAGGAMWLVLKQPSRDAAPQGAAAGTGLSPSAASTGVPLIASAPHLGSQAVPSSSNQGPAALAPNVGSQAAAVSSLPSPVLSGLQLQRPARPVSGPVSSSPPKPATASPTAHAAPSLAPPLTATPTPAPPESPVPRPAIGPATTRSRL